jgi:cytochrome P450
MCFGIRSITGYRISLANAAVVDIYGSATQKPIPKDDDVYAISKNVASIVGTCPHIPPTLTADPQTASNDADHTRIRRLLNHAFSDSALRNQEDIINAYITLFIKKLQPKAEAGTPVDIMRYLNFTTFDILGDLCFADSFGALDSEDYGSWVSGVFNALKMTRMLRVIRSYYAIGVPFFWLLKRFPGIVKARQRHQDYTKQKMDKRINTATERKDFMRCDHLPFSKYLKS